MEHQLLKAGQTFASRYRIERFLAEGGMGAVFVGEHTATEQRVAVKVLWPHVLGSRDAVEKFQLEARVAGRVSSDHIVRVIDAGYDDETRMPFLVMELLTGKTLDALVVDGGPLAPAVLLSLMRQVASGLDKAHGYVDKDGVPKPIVHRDLKPENLFLAQRDSGEPLVKILDFGIAKVVSEGTHVSQEIKGTPLFMAFEQAGGGRITPRTDIWALGLIVFYLLTGKNYWRSAQPDVEAGITQLFGEVISLPIDPPSIRLRELGAEPPWLLAFDDWFLRCVNRDTNARFPTAGEAIASLGHALPLDAEAMAAAASYVPGGAGGTLVMRPVEARTAGGAAPGPMYSSGTSGISGTGNPSVSQSLTPASSSKAVVIAIAVVAGVLLLGGVGTLVVLQSQKPSTTVTQDPPPPASAPVRDATQTEAVTPVTSVTPVATVTPAASVTASGASPAVPAPPTASTPAHPGAGVKPPPDPNSNGGKTKPPAPATATPPPATGKPPADPYGDR